MDWLSDVCVIRVNFLWLPSQIRLTTKDNNLYLDVHLIITFSKCIQCFTRYTCNWQTRRVRTRLYHTLLQTIRPITQKVMYLWIVDLHLLWEILLFAVPLIKLPHKPNHMSILRSSGTALESGIKFFPQWIIDLMNSRVFLSGSSFWSQGLVDITYVQTCLGFFPQSLFLPLV